MNLGDTNIRSVAGSQLSILRVSRPLLRILERDTKRPTFIQPPAPPIYTAQPLATPPPASHVDQHGTNYYRVHRSSIRVLVVSTHGFF